MSMTRGCWTIGAVSRSTGLRASAIRYYERLGLLPLANRVGGRRFYDERVFSRLQLIELAKTAGFTLFEIRTLLSEQSDSWHQIVDRKLPWVEEELKRLLEMKRLLSAARTCKCLDLATCVNQSAVGPSHTKTVKLRRQRQERRS